MKRKPGAAPAHDGAGGTAAAPGARKTGSQHHAGADLAPGVPSSIDATRVPLQQRPLAPLPLPHERDEAVADTAQEPDRDIEQALHDIDAGMVDTDMRATPGLDADTRARLVPGAAGKTRKPPP